MTNTMQDNKNQGTNEEEATCLNDQMNAKENLASIEFQKTFKQASMNILSEIQLVKSLFQVEQIKCKKDFDVKSNHFSNQIEAHANLTSEDDFQFENFDNSMNIHEFTRSQIDYINRFKLLSPAGNLKFKLNLELIFFTNLKSLRLRYINKLNELNNQLDSAKQNYINSEIMLTNAKNKTLPEDISIDSAINSSSLFDSSSFMTKISKQSSLTLIDSISSHSEEDNMLLSTISSNFTNITSAIASTNTIRNANMSANSKTLRDTDLFSSVISSICSSVETDSATENKDSITSETKNSIFNTNQDLGSLKKLPTFSASSPVKFNCQRCARKRQYRLTKSLSDVRFNIKKLEGVK